MPEVESSILSWPIIFLLLARKKLFLCVKKETETAITIYMKQKHYLLSKKYLVIKMAAKKKAAKKR
jgi:hypothetical protein